MDRIKMTIRIWKCYITKLPDEKLKFSRDEKDICAFNINGCSLPTGKYLAMCYSAADYRIVLDILMQKTSYPKCYKFGK